MHYITAATGAAAGGRRAGGAVRLAGVGASEQLGDEDTVGAVVGMGVRSSSVAMLTSWTWLFVTGLAPSTRTSWSPRIRRRFRRGSPSLRWVRPSSCCRLRTRFYAPVRHKVPPLGGKCRQLFAQPAVSSDSDPNCRDVAAPSPRPCRRTQRPFTTTVHQRCDRRERAGMCPSRRGGVLLTFSLAGLDVVDDDEPKLAAGQLLDLEQFESSDDIYSPPMALASRARS